MAGLYLLRLLGGLVAPGAVAIWSCPAAVARWLGGLVASWFWLKI